MSTWLICGGRGWTSDGSKQRFVDQVLKDLLFHLTWPKLLIHGGATGYDTYAGDWANQYGLPVQVYHADWENLGYSAGPVRNARMLKEGKPSLIVGFPGGSGTRDMLARGIAAKVSTFKVEPTPDGGFQYISNHSLFLPEPRIQDVYRVPPPVAG